MKKTALFALLLCGVALAQPPYFPYGIPVGGSSGGGGGGGVDSAAVSGIVSDSLRYHTVTMTNFGGKTYRVYGNSLAERTGFIVWPDYIPGLTGMGLTNRAASGARMEQDRLIGRIYRDAANGVFNDSSNVGFETSGNDITDQTATADYIRVYSAGVARIFGDNRTRWAPDSATFSGTWSSVDSVYGNPFRSTTQSGAYAQFSCRGRWCVIGTEIDTGGGTWGISVNGAPSGTWSARMTAPMGSGDTTRAPASFVIGPLDTGTHTIRLTANNSGRLAFSWFYGATGNIQSFPRGYSHGCVVRPAYDAARLLLCAQYTVAMDSIDNVFRRMGFSMQTIQIPVMPDSFFQNDGIHPDTLGAKVIADSMAKLVYTVTLQQAVTLGGSGGGLTNPTRKIAVGLGADTAAFFFNSSTIQSKPNVTGGSGLEIVAYGVENNAPAIRLIKPGTNPNARQATTGTRDFPNQLGVVVGYGFPASGASVSPTAGARMGPIATGNWNNVSNPTGWMFTGTHLQHALDSSWASIEDGGIQSSSQQGTSHVPGRFPAVMTSTRGLPSFCGNAFYYAPTDQWRFARGSDGAQYATCITTDVTTGNIYIRRSRNTGTFPASIPDWDTVWASADTFGVRSTKQFVRQRVTAVSAPEILSRTEVAELVEDLSASRDSELLPAAQYGPGRCIEFWARAVGVNSWDIYPDGSETIDGATGPVSITNDYGALRLCTLDDASGWIMFPMK